VSREPSTVLVIRSALSALIFLLLTPCFLAAQFPMSTNRPQENEQPAEIRQLVANYCRMDYEGGRLDPQAWSRIEPLVWWKSNPEFTQVSVVARYTVDPEPASVRGKYNVTVHYRLLGTYDLSAGYAPEPEISNQDADFVVSLDNTEWRIASAENTSPHASRAAMLKWLTDKVATTQDAQVKARYQDAQKQLQAQSASPFAK
jgi:hypothetical protein